MNDSFYYLFFLLGYIIIQVGLVAFSVKLFKSILNPLSLYSIVFLMAIIFNLILPIYHPSEFVWLLLYLTALVFFIGSIIGVWFGRAVSSGDKFDKLKHARHLRFYSQTYNTLASLGIIISILCLAMFIFMNRLKIIEVLSTKGLASVYSFYSFYYRSEIWRLPYIEGIIMLAALAAGISDGFFSKFQRKSSLLLLIVIVFTFLTGTRTLLLISAGIYFFSYYLAKKASRAGESQLFIRSNIKSIIKSLIMVFIVILAIFLITIGRMAPGKADIGLNEDTGFLEFFALELGGGSIARLESVFENEEFSDFYPGAFTLGPILRFPCSLFVNKEICKEAFPYLQPFTSMPFTWNVGTYITDFYLDFNILGVIVGSFIIALFASFFWISAAKRKLNFIVPAAFLTTIIVLSFRFTLTFAGSFWIMIFSWLFFTGIYRLFVFLIKPSITASTTPPSMLMTKFI